MALLLSPECGKTTNGESDELDTIWIAFYSAIGFLFTVLMGKLRCNLPARISTVPLTMNTFTVNLLPTLVGCRISTLSAILYHLYLSCVDRKHFYAPTAGYFIGFILASAQIGSMVQDTHFRHSNANLAISMLMGNVTILFCGMLWMPCGLALKTGKTVSQFCDLPFLLNEAVIPFIPGAIIKIIFAVCARTCILFVCSSFNASD